MDRRSFIAGLGAAFAAPAVVRFESLMPVRALAAGSVLTIDDLTRAAIKLFVNSNRFLQNLEMYNGLGYNAPVHIRLPYSYSVAI